MSGAAVKEGIRYSSDYASSEYGKVLGRIQNLAGLGMQATTAGNAAIVGLSPNIQQGYSQAGQASAYSKQGKYEAYGSAINEIAKGWGQKKTTSSAPNIPVAADGKKYWGATV